MNSPSNQVVQEVPEELLDRLREYVPPEEPGGGSDDEAGRNRREYKADLIAAIDLLAAYPAIRKEIESKVRAEERERLLELIAAVLDAQEAGVLEIAAQATEQDEAVRARRCEDDAAVIRNDKRLILAAISDTQEAQGG